MMKTVFIICLSAFLTAWLFAAPAGQPDWISLLDQAEGPAFRGFKMEALPENWSLEGGILKASGGNRDIITLEQYQHFELQLEYRLQKGGNSGRD